MKIAMKSWKWKKKCISAIFTALRWRQKQLQNTVFSRLKMELYKRKSEAGDSSYSLNLYEILLS
jgi:hypothetical protein